MGGLTSRDCRETHSELVNVLCTISGNVKLHQLHEVGHLGGESLDLIVTEAELP